MSKLLWLIVCLHFAFPFSEDYLDPKSLKLCGCDHYNNGFDMNTPMTPNWQVDFQPWYALVSFIRPKNTINLKSIGLQFSSIT